MLPFPEEIAIQIGLEAADVANVILGCANFDELRSVLALVVSQISTEVFAASAFLNGIGIEVPQFEVVDATTQTPVGIDEITAITNSKQEAK